MNLFENIGQWGVAETSLFIIFALVIILFLVIDLGVFSKKPQSISLKSAFWLTIFWIVVALLFGVLVYFFVSPEHAYLYLVAYVVEQSLAADNLFIFLVILQFFNIEEKYYHRILFWGIIGAIFFRLVFLSVGLVLVSYFEWVLYIFGGFLIYTGIKLLTADRTETFKPQDSFIYRYLLKRIRYINSQAGGRFFVIRNNSIYFTTLFLALVLIEISDIVFAVDSIPAVLAITQDPFIVYTSNIFAILGLRAMFFLLAGSIHHFPFLHQALSIILIYIGSKMFLEIAGLKITPELSLLIVLGVLGSSILLSWARNKGYF